MITLDEATHTYRVDGRVVRSVTQVLADAGMVDTRFFTEEGRDRGHKVHMITEMYDEGSLIEHKVPDDLKGYLRAWQKFLHDTKAVVVETEKMVYCPTLNYAGQFDKILEWNGRDWIADIKGHTSVASERVQTAAYANCKANPLPLDRVAIHLLPNGKYRKETHGIEDFERDFDTFRAALVISRWRREHMKGMMDD